MSTKQFTNESHVCIPRGMPNDDFRMYFDEPRRIIHQHENAESRRARRYAVREMW